MFREVSLFQRGSTVHTHVHILLAHNIFAHGYISFHSVWTKSFPRNLLVSSYFLLLICLLLFMLRCFLLLLLLGINEFRKLVRENAIVTDAESADNLFRLLSQNSASEPP